jgi:hypothetical protein
MATITTYWQGGYIPAAAQQNRRELYDGTAATYTAWDVNGNVTTTRALTTGEAAQLAAQDAANTSTANGANLQAKLTAAITANGNDTTQDVTIQSGAATINGTATPFTLAQCTNFIKQLATAVSTLAGNDVNSKRELTAIMKLMTNALSDTNGT